MLTSYPDFAKVPCMVLDPLAARLASFGLRARDLTTVTDPVNPAAWRVVVPSFDGRTVADGTLDDCMFLVQSLFRLKG